ncbi:hypothetical protein HanPI659440_Chr16g0653091 [Helianthus annuus]|nr:hypothetical protein HanPI659440_Chr16g0653091 [Helianthus annuus]
MAFDCQELLRSILDPEMTHTLYDGQWMMVVDDGVVMVVGVIRALFPKASYNNDLQRNLIDVKNVCELICNIWFNFVLVWLYSLLYILPD